MCLVQCQVVSLAISLGNNRSYIFAEHKEAATQGNAILHVAWSILSGSGKRAFQNRLKYLFAV